MSQKDDQDTMRAEYGFSGGVRGKPYEAYRQGSNLVIVEPDVANIFKDAATVYEGARAGSQTSAYHWDTLRGQAAIFVKDSNQRKFHEL